MVKMGNNEMNNIWDEGAQKHVPLGNHMSAWPTDMLIDSRVVQLGTNQQHMRLASI